MIYEQEICLANLHTKSPEEVFEYGAKHLLTQGKRSITGFHCAYRNEDGLRCGAGCFIAPSEYREDFEGQSWVRLVVTKAVTCSHSALITELQLIHDRCGVKNWPTKLAKLRIKLFATNENE
jgi:hypothetical protein